MIIKYNDMIFSTQIYAFPFVINHAHYRRIPLLVFLCLNKLQYSAYNNIFGNILYNNNNNCKI